MKGFTIRFEFLINQSQDRRHGLGENGARMNSLLKINQALAEARMVTIPTFSDTTFAVQSSLLPDEKKADQKPDAKLRT